VVIRNQENHRVNPTYLISSEPPLGYRRTEILSIRSKFVLKLSENLRHGLNILSQRL
jgi:hypothetical protein